MIKKAICIGATVVAVCLTTGYLSNCKADTKQVEYQYYTVRPGDTLWDIADKFNKDAKEDPRKIIYEINQDNEIKNGLIKVGDTIKVRKR